MRFRRALSLLVALILITVGCAGPVGQRTQQGALLGGIIGALAGYGLGGNAKAGAVGAAAGAVIGAAAGAALGKSEAKAAYAEPQPLPWLLADGKPKSIQVAMRQGWGYGSDVTAPVIEEQLKRRGGVVVRNPGPQYYPFRPQLPETTATDYVAEVNVIERYGAATIDLQVLDKARQLIASAEETVAFGAAGYYTGDDRIAALRIAARNVVWKLH